MFHLHWRSGRRSDRRRCRSFPTAQRTLGQLQHFVVLKITHRDENDLIGAESLTEDFAQVRRSGRCDGFFGGRSYMIRMIAKKDLVASARCKKERLGFALFERVRKITIGECEFCVRERSDLKNVRKSCYG